MAIAHRDDASLASGLASWTSALHPQGPAVRTVRLRRPSTGWSNETLLARVDWPDRTDEVVVRVPPLTPSFPDDTLRTEASVLHALARCGLPVPRPIAVERDERWLGAPFLVMTFVAGRAVGAAPSRDPWVVDAPVERQRSVQEQFLTALATVHRIDWRGAGLATLVRGGDRTDKLAAELGWWASYIDWAADGSPARRLAEQARWCRHNMPSSEPDGSLCWGDARLGNTMYDDDGALVALLDWELASIGPAEMDLAWYLALDELTARYAGGVVPGFLDRADAVRLYEQELGRAVLDLEWHEIFALVRSTAVNDRQARIARSAGVDYPGGVGDDNAVLRWVDHKIERFERSP